MNSNQCRGCNKLFNNRSNLRRHVIKFHANEEVNDLAPLKKKNKVYAFTCSDCGRNYNDKNNYFTHKRKFHTVLLPTEEKRVSFDCALCKESILKAQYSCHLKDVHELSLFIDALEFSSYEEFIKWKRSVEIDTKSSFVTIRGNKRKASGERRIYYYCHRSGHYITKGVGKRRIKTQGSKKINSYCPAGIKLLIKNDGVCNVKYTKTHVGHKHELSYLSLSKAQRETLVAKIAAEVPFNDILDEVRDSVVNDELERVHLLTRKNLVNLKKNNAKEIGVLAAQVTMNKDLAKSKADFLLKMKNLLDNAQCQEELDILMSCLNSAVPRIEAFRLSKAKQANFSAINHEHTYSKTT